MVPYPPPWNGVPDPRQYRNQRRTRIIGGVLVALLAAGLMAMAIASAPAPAVRTEFEAETFTELQLDSSGEWLLFASSNATGITCQATGPDGTAAELSFPDFKGVSRRAAAADGSTMDVVFELQVPDPGTYTVGCTGPDGSRFAIGPPLDWLVFEVLLGSSILVVVGPTLAVRMSAMIRSLPSWRGPQPGQPGWDPRR